MVLMYLHGFRSTPMSKKGQIMREAFSGRVQYLAPDLNTSPSHVQTIIQEAIKGIAPEELCLVGSSLGGFYATWLAEKVGCRAILLNPATEPWSVINDYLGLQPIGNTNRFIEVKPEFADELRQMNCERIHPERYLVFLSTHDEVLDWHKAKSKYAACRQILLPGNTHEIDHFEQCLPEIEHFFAEVPQKRTI